MNDVLNIWTVYDHPTDYPSNFVARRMEIYYNGAARMTDDLLISQELAEIQKRLQDRGLHRINRMKGDDSKIVECWI